RGGKVLCPGLDRMCDRMPVRRVDHVASIIPGPARRAVSSGATHSAQMLAIRCKFEDSRSEVAFVLRDKTGHSGRDQVLGSAIAGDHRRYPGGGRFKDYVAEGVRTRRKHKNVEVSVGSR